MNRQLVGRARARFAPETAANNQGQPPDAVGVSGHRSIETALIDIAD